MQAWALRPVLGFAAGRNPMPQHFGDAVLRRKRPLPIVRIGRESKRLLQLTQRHAPHLRCDERTLRCVHGDDGLRKRHQSPVLDAS